ncbi:alpha/beta fold hydrolase [Nocardia sp. NPDC058633]|uniref:alpha/beta fold hydrolase n=1 Tax=Nocardia sp. NPDC058633 TaxID=3346568 RepID=UPI00364B9CB1
MPSVYKNLDCQRMVRDRCVRRLDAWDAPHERGEISTVAGPTSVVALGPAPTRAEPSIALVPGTNMNAALSLEIAGSLARRWHTVVFDVPGQPGLSADRRPRRGRTQWYGEWLAEALERTIRGPVVVVGHSLGGAIALSCPSPQITGRVLVSPAGLARLAVTPSVLAATVPWLARPTTTRTRRLLRHMVAPGHQVPDELTEWMTLVARCCRSSLAPMPLPPETLAARRTSTTLVATGRHDVFLPPNRIGPATRHRLGIGLRVLDGAGHLVLDEQPGAVVDLVDEVIGAL